MIQTICKTLSSNDVGETRAHQAGILIPKDPRILGFFPKLNRETLNPRTQMTFTDEAGDQCNFWFIYYNNGLFGGTRNEYRLTHMTKWIRVNSLKEGDEIQMTRNRDGDYQIKPRRVAEGPIVKSGVIKLGLSWKIIKIKK